MQMFVRDLEKPASRFSLIASEQNEEWRDTFSGGQDLLIPCEDGVISLLFIMFCGRFALTMLFSKETTGKSVCVSTGMCLMM